MRGIAFALNLAAALLALYCFLAPVIGVLAMSAPIVETWLLALAPSLVGAVFCGMAAEWAHDLADMMEPG